MQWNKHWLTGGSFRLVKAISEYLLETYPCYIKGLPNNFKPEKKTWNALSPRLIHTWNVFQQKTKPLQAVEFITHLAKCEPVHKHEEEAFVQWYLKVGWTIFFVFLKSLAKLPWSFAVNKGQNIPLVVQLGIHLFYYRHRLERKGINSWRTTMIVVKKKRKNQERKSDQKCAPN